MKPPVKQSKFWPCTCGQKNLRKMFHYLCDCGRRVPKQLVHMSIVHSPKDWSTQHETPR